MKYRIEIEIEVDDIEAQEYAEQYDLETMKNAVEHEIIMQIINDEEITIDKVFVNNIEEIEE